VLSLRLVIFASISAIALWGLFSLLDNLREPELLRTGETLVVKGCDPIESQDARRLCPQLFCRKFLLDARTVATRDTFEFTVDTRAGSEQLVGGRIGASQPAGEQRFACILRNDKVTAGRLLDAAGLDALSAQPASWSLD
jgi:hypothetical protein